MTFLGGEEKKVTADTKTNAGILPPFGYAQGQDDDKEWLGSKNGSARRSIWLIHR
jgi:hypothetical protein